jgi:hypothetical protein
MALPGNRYSRMGLRQGRRRPSAPVRQRTDERPPTNMSGNLVADEKPDTMIAGREDGRPSGPGDERPDQASLPRQLSAAPINPQNPTPLSDQNDRPDGAVT